MFSALRQGNPFYILEKGSMPVLKIGQIESVTQPRPKYSTYNPALTFSMNVETVVDIVVKVQEEKLEFKGVPSNLSIANFGSDGVVISESRDAMVSEVDSMLQTSKSILDSVEYHKGVIDACEQMLRDLNPNFAKEQEREAQIDNLAKQVETMQTEFGVVKGDISKILGLLTKAA